MAKSQAAPPPKGKAPKANRAPTPDPSRRKKDKDAELWQSRLTAATKVYDTWSTRFHCDRLDDYYEGRQWADLATDSLRDQKYTINRVFATVETQLPSLLFSKPKVKVEARPASQETATSDAGNRATLIEQALQSQVDNPELAFTFETTLALRDAYSRFAIVEVGYSSDWIDNPNAGKPVLKDDETPLLDEAGKAISEPTKTPKKESLFVKRLAPEDIRVSPGRNRLEANDWVAVAEWHYADDITRNPAYENTADLSSTARLVTDEEQASGVTTEDERERTKGMVRVWRIWDLRTHTRMVLADGHPRFLQQGTAFSVLPLADLKFYERRNAYYPLPPIYNWLTPQDEKNEIREMRRVHRRRATRRYMRHPSVTQVEFEKLESGDDMICIEVPTLEPVPIKPIEDAPLDPQIWPDAQAGDADWSEITGVTGEARSLPAVKTATQANIVNTRAELRESRARTQVAEWLARICRLMLINLREKTQLPLMVRQSADAFAARSDPQGVSRSVQGWAEIKAEDLGTLDVEIAIDVTSLSPVAQDTARGQWTQVLALLTNPQLLMFLMEPVPEAPTDPSPLLRKTLALNGVTSDQEVREIFRVGQALMAKVQLAAQASQRPQPMTISLALKGEDLGNPAVMAVFAREEMLMNQPTAASPFGNGTGNGNGNGGSPTIPALPANPAAGVPTHGTAVQ